MAEYYRRRAPTYDEVYAFEARANDLKVLRAWLALHVRDRSVLEVAAGTGYWTEVAAGTACSVLATDINREALDIAAGKALGSHVSLVQADAWALPLLTEPPEIGMAHLWWSHVRVQDQVRFLTHLGTRLRPGGHLLMIDETFVRHFSTPLSRRDGAGNGYQARMLSDGTLFEIVKNYPDRQTLTAGLEPACQEIEILWLSHFWAVSAIFR